MLFFEYQIVYRAIGSFIPFEKHNHTSCIHNIELAPFNPVTLLYIGRLELFFFKKCIVFLYSNMLLHGKVSVILVINNTR